MNGNPIHPVAIRFRERPSPVQMSMRENEGFLRMATAHR
jgi:hypothetical protein